MPVTHAAYLAALDRLAQAVVLEAEQADRGPEAMARWAKVAVPRFLELSAIVDQAELEDWGQAAVWFAGWRADRLAAGTWPFSAPVRAEAGRGGGIVRL